MSEHVHEQCNNSTCEDHYEKLETPVEQPATPVAVSGELAGAVAGFEKGFRQRSFSGRNPTLGKMIKCLLCGLRHRETECHVKEQKFANKPGTPEGESAPMLAMVKHFHPVGNPFWRAHPGRFQWIKELKKFVRIVR